MTGQTFDYKPFFSQAIYDRNLDCDPRNYHGKYMQPSFTIKPDTFEYTVFASNENWFRRWLVSWLFGWKLRDL